MGDEKYEGDGVLRMKKSPYGGYDVVQTNVIGWK